MRQFFYGLYGFHLQGFLRATDYKEGAFSLGLKNPISQQPIVMIGFFPGNLGVNFGTTPIDTGYFPWSVAGIISYHPNLNVDGHARVCIGGNTDDKLHDFSGTYKLISNFEGTCTITDNVANHDVNFYFVLTDNDNEIHFMTIDGMPEQRARAKAGEGSGAAVGVQKRITVNFTDRGIGKRDV